MVFWPHIGYKYSVVIYMDVLQTQVLVLGSGTAGSNSARAAVAAGARSVTLVQPHDLINTCVEEGCMPSKSVLAGAHQHEAVDTVLTTRDSHIRRLRTALSESLEREAFTIVCGRARFVDTHTVEIDNEETTVQYRADAIVIATGSSPFVPPITGISELTIGTELLTSEQVLRERTVLEPFPKRVLTLGAGPVGLELSTFFHDAGSAVCVLQRDQLLSTFDPEFGVERTRASHDSTSFPIHTESTLTKVERVADGLECTCVIAGTETVFLVDAILVATGRRPHIAELQLTVAGVQISDRGDIEHNQYLQTSMPHIYVAGDVTGHHQILHYAAQMGKVAGTNAAQYGERTAMEYDRYALAVSFDAYPSAQIGLTEKEAIARGMKVVTATKYFKDFGLGILKRQEYGLWKLVAEADTGRVLGSQVLGPESAGELVQLLSPVIWNRNTVYDVTNMTWYHPTYAEAIGSLAHMILHDV